MSNEFLGSFAVVRKHLWLIALICVVTVGTILYLGYTAPPAYQARVRLRALAVEPESVSLFSPTPYVPSRDQIIATREEFFSFLASRSVAWKTIADLGLTGDADALLRRLTFQEQDDFIVVIATAERADLAERLATTYVANALHDYREYRLVPANQGVQFIAGQLDNEKRSLADAQDALLRFKLANNIESLPTEIQSLQSEIRGLRLDRDRAVIDEQQSVAVQQTYQTAAGDALRNAVAVLGAGTPSAGVTPLAAGAALSTTNSADTSNTVDTAALTAGLNADSRQQLARVLQDQYLRYNDLVVEQQTAVQKARAAQARYDQMIAQREAELSALIGLHADYDNLQTAVTRAEDAYSFLADKANEAQLKENQGLNAGYLQIVEPARTPSEPAPSQTLRIALVGGVAAILAGIVLAFVLEYLSGVGRAAGGQQPAQAKSGS